jgi:hypothetical protein
MSLISILLIFYASASPNKCTTWKQGNTSNFCTFNGESARVWFRTCLNTEDKEELCWTENPDAVKGNCSEWIQLREKCTLKQGGFGDKWIRACKTLKDRTDICLESDPNLL